MPSGILLCCAVQLLASPARGSELVRHREVVGRVRGQDVGYHVVLPARPTEAMPVLVVPVHPRGYPPPDRTRPPQRATTWALVQLDGFNVLYARYPEDRYLRVSRNPRLLRRVAEFQREALARAVADHDLGADRLVCFGISASGNACWDLALRWPGVFAGVLPVAAGFNPDHAPSACWANLAGQQVYVLHGSEDPLIPSAWVDASVARARAEGATVVEVRVQGAGHGDYAADVWDAAFNWAESLSPPVAPLDRCASAR